MEEKNKYPGLERAWAGNGWLYNIGTGTDMAVWTGEEGVEEFYKHIENYIETELSNISPIDRAKKYQHEFNLKLRDSNKE